MFNTIEEIDKELKLVLEKKDDEGLELLLNFMWKSEDKIQYIELLNELLVHPNHIKHQSITWKIQKIGSPTSIPYIRKVLESNFEYLEYTCSESGVIAKWFSWALASIGTKEAIELMKEYSHHKDEGISNEMKYRLNKLKNN